MATTEDNIHSTTGENSEAVHTEENIEHAEEHTEEVSHEATLFAEPVFNIGNFTVTNSLLNSWLAVLIVLVFSITLAKKVKKIPGKLQSMMEIVVDGALNLADSVTGDRKISLKVFPAVFGIFIFVLVNNWLGLIPGIGSVGFIQVHDGHQIFVPLFRGATADINTTLALALFSVVASNIFGVLIVGAWKYFNKFINVKTLLSMPKDIKKSPTAVIVNPITFFVGILEIVGELAKVASLAFRLFGNIFAGEVLLAAMAVIFAYGLPIPFMFLEVIVGIIQALIFAMLTLVYFTIAAQDHSEEH